MATLESMQDLLDSMGTSQIPGLDTINVIGCIIENNPVYKSQLDATQSSEERSELKATLVESLKKHGSSYINEQINTIKALHSQVVTGISQLTQNITLTISAALIPSAVPAAPNPAFVALDLKVKKSTFSRMCDDLFEMFRRLLQAAINISFLLPDSVLGLFQGLNTVKSLLDTIPV